ncbi:regulatory protein GemA [Loktanella sp. TSTF-M6]|uniref:Regulatory protein GemA n=1 Tax=Loktanella gaetbuli TaxID=2881335 RepID=A0ABS8BS63_9RHOB|nr:regulatory protein GemA [Loktanella gaetbuli]MCB5198575.1 regulatory protein GemA [Loktanella gaetbuli]
MTRALQRLVHVACRELAIDADTRRYLQLVVTGKASMADMDEADLQKLLTRLKEKGFRVTATGKRKAAPRADLRYIHVLWRLLGEDGALDRPGRAGLNAFVRSRFAGKWASVPIDIDALQDAGQINDVTRALKDWCARRCIKTER